MGWLAAPVRPNQPGGGRGGGGGRSAKVICVTRILLPLTHTRQAQSTWGREGRRRRAISQGHMCHPHPPAPHTHPSGPINLGEGGEEEEGDQPRSYLSPASSCHSHTPFDCCAPSLPPCMHLPRPSPSSYPPPPITMSSLSFSQGATTARSCCTHSVRTSFTASRGPAA